MQGAIRGQLGIPLGRQEGGLLAANRLCVDVVRALCDGNGLPLEELHAVVLDKEGCGPCTASLGARFVGSIKLDKQRSGGWWGMFGVETEKKLAPSCTREGETTYTSELGVGHGALARGIRAAGGAGHRVLAEGIKLGQDASGGACGAKPARKCDFLSEVFLTSLQISQVRVCIHFCLL